MKQTNAPETTPTPHSQPSAKSPSAIFLNMALDMTWRLAIVVLIPLIGGFKLDESLGSAPAFTILGFVLALSGMTYVLWRTVKLANEVSMPKKEKTK